MKCIFELKFDLQTNRGRFFRTKKRKLLCVNEMKHKEYSIGKHFFSFGLPENYFYGPECQNVIEGEKK